MTLSSDPSAPPVDAPVKELTPAQQRKRDEFVDKKCGTFVERYSSFVSTDKPIYNPGDTVYVRINVLDAFRHQCMDKSNVEGVISVSSPKGDKVFEAPVGLSNSSAAVAWYIDPSRSGGDYKIHVIFPFDRISPSTRKFNVQVHQPSRLKLQLEFKRKGLGPGDIAHATLECERSEGGFPEGASVLAVARIDGEEVFRDEDLTINAEGKCDVQFQLPQEIEVGDGTLTCTVSDGGVVESKGKTIPIILKKIDCRVYPEGGEFVAGCECGFYIEAFTISGDPADMLADIVMVNGESDGDDGDSGDGAEERVVGTIVTEHEGRGYSTFTPLSGMKYELHVVEPAGVTIPVKMPEVKDSGVCLRTPQAVVEPHEPLYCWVESPIGGDFIVSCYRREREICSVRVSLLPNTAQEVYHSLPDVLDGVIRITVSDLDNELPMAERLVFRRPSESLDVSLIPDKEIYTPGSDVVLEMSVKDSKGKPIPALASITVVDDSVLEKIDRRKQAPRLPTMFFLEDEVNELNDSFVYLYETFVTDEDRPPKVDPSTCLDLLLGTQGWRRFVYYDPLTYLEKAKDKEIALRTLAIAEDPKVKFTIPEPPPRPKLHRRNRGPPPMRRGRGGGRGGPPLPAGAGRDRMKMKKKEKGGGGGAMRFEAEEGLNDFAMGGAMPMMAIAAAAAAAPMIMLQQAIQPQAPPAPPPPARAAAAAALPAAPAAPAAAPPPPAPVLAADMLMGEMEDMKMEIMEEPMDEEEEQEEEKMMMKEEKAKPAMKKAKKKMAAPREREKRLDRKPIRRRRISDDDDSDDEDERVQIAPTPAGNEFKLPEIPVQPSAIKGLAYERQYAYKRSPTSTSSDSTQRSDFQETLYFDAGLKIKSDIPSKISFATSDLITGFRVCVDVVGLPGGANRQAIGAFGLREKMIVSKKNFYIEPKIPNEVTLGDRIDVPLVFVNASEKKIEVDVKGKYDGGAVAVKGASIKKKVTIAAGKRLRSFYPIEMKSIPVDFKASVYFKAKVSKALHDSVEKVFGAMPLGFPRYSKFAGTLTPDASQEAVVDLPKDTVASSVSFRLAMQLSTGSTLTEALKALVREPCGCFEQTSSTTYPMVMACLYFKLHSSDKGAKESLQKALDIMKKGLKKLMGFECKDGGFEWFGGSAPGHEALTAYGMLQFAEMQQFIMVDPNMISRTRKWLKSRRDGAGQIQQNKKALDSFGRAPAYIASAYVLWSLGMGSKDKGEISDYVEEIKWMRTFKKGTSDAYFAALLAGLLYKLKNPEATGHSRRLVELQSKEGSIDECDSTITCSYGVGKKIEVTSLAILAWLQESELFQKNAALGINWLRKQCTGGRFGSTQSTILALKAIVAWDDRFGMSNCDGNVVVKINGKEVVRKNLKEALLKAPAGTVVFDLKEGIDKQLLIGERNSVEVFAEKSKVPFNFLVEYNCQTPEDSSECPLELTTSCGHSTIGEGEGTDISISLKNKSPSHKGMTIAIIGIPGGCEPRVAKLQELVKSNTLDFFETRGREVICYWRQIKGKEKKEFKIDIVASVPGKYAAPASRAYLYYGDEDKVWRAGVGLTITAKQ